VTNYVHEHSWETTFALLSVLSITIVLVILFAIDFFVIESIAKSIAIAWQFLIEIVIIKISFAFLQSVAMNKATTNVFYDAKVVDLIILASKKVVN